MSSIGVVACDCSTGAENSAPAERYDGDRICSNVVDYNSFLKDPNYASGGVIDDIKGVFSKKCIKGYEYTCIMEGYWKLDKSMGNPIHCN